MTEAGSATRPRGRAGDRPGRGQAPRAAVAGDLHADHQPLGQSRAHARGGDADRRWQHRSLGGTARLYAVGRPSKAPRLVVFPEFNLQGFPVRESTAEWIEKACLRIPGSPRGRAGCRRSRSPTGSGSVRTPTRRRTSGRHVLQLQLPDRSVGNVVLKYRRVSTEQGFSPHDILERYLDRHGIDGLWPVARTEIGNLAMMPCGEILWPETARCLTLRGAEVILHPTSDHGRTEFMAWGIGEAHPRRREHGLPRLGERRRHRRWSAVGAEHRPLEDLRLPGPRARRHKSAGESTRAFAVIDVEMLRRARCTPGGLFGVNRLARLRVEAYAPVYAPRRSIRRISGPTGR